MQRVAVVGATSWGTTLAVMLAERAHVSLIARTQEEAQTLTSERQNKRRRPGLSFPPSLSVTIDPEALATADLVLLAVPSASLRNNLVRLAPALSPEASLLIATKGVEPDTCLRMSQVVAAFGVEPERCLTLSGPNFAAEIARGLPAASVVATISASRAAAVQALLNGPSFRVYTSDDVAGVEIGGALKNVVAIACGLSDALGYGENAKAGLITRALAEITRLGVASGGQAVTFLGLAGMGDLILTCQSDLSRNRRLGLALARAGNLPEAIASIDGVVEGLETARAIPALVKGTGVELPICQQLYQVLYEGKTPRDAVEELMTRAAKPEFDGSVKV